MTPGSGTPDRARRDGWLIAVVAFIAYLPTFAGVFQFDDYNVIVNYPTVHSWPALLDGAGGGVRPLLKASYALNWTLGPGEIGFHLFNIAAHAFNAVLLYAIGSRLCARWFGEGENRSRDVALIAALLFALHPAQTEAVTYISGRSSSLMASFYLGALLVYLRGGHWAVSTLLFVLALATRETAATLPAALLLCELCGRDRRGRKAFWKHVLRRQSAHWAVLVAGTVVVLLHPRYSELVSYGFTQRDAGVNLLTQVGGISYLISRLVGLRGYNIDPALVPLADWDAKLGVQAALLAALLALGVASVRSRPWIAFGILWFFLQLAPTNSIVPRLDVANDRQLYLSSWGLFVGLSAQVSSSLPRAAPVHAVLGALLGLLLGLCVLSCVARQLDYASEIALWESSVREAPWNARAHNNLGYAYYRAGRTDDAENEYRSALILRPAYGKARFNLRALEWDREFAPE
jgi:protein O-mannosyl-transferase